MIITKMHPRVKYHDLTSIRRIAQLLLFEINYSPNSKTSGRELFVMGFFAKHVAGEGKEWHAFRDRMRFGTRVSFPKKHGRREGEFIARTRTGGQARI